MYLNQLDIELKLRENRELLRQLEIERQVRRAIALNNPSRPQRGFFCRRLAALGKAMVGLGNALQERYSDECVKNMSCAEEQVT